MSSVSRYVAVTALTNMNSTAATEEESTKSIGNMTSNEATEEEVSNEDYLPTIDQFKTGIGDEIHMTLLVLSILLTTAIYFLYFYHVYCTGENVHKSMRIHTAWITSVFPFMVLTSVVALFIPRTHDFMTAIKIIYMCIGFSNFTQLTIIQFGGKLALINSLEESPIHGIFDRHCTCLPWVPTSKESVLLLFWLTYQMPWSEALYFVIGLATVIGKSGPDGVVEPVSNIYWLAALNLLSFFSGVVGLQLIIYLSWGKLKQYNYDNKAIVMRLMLILTKFQNVFLSILFSFGVFPSVNGYFNARVYRQSIENGIHIIGMSILGTYTLLIYSKPPKKKISDSLEGNTNHTVQNGEEEAVKNITEKHSEDNEDKTVKNIKESYKCIDNIEKDMIDIDLETNNVEVISNNTNES